MAPLAPSNTARFRIFYTVGGLQHSFEVRTGGSPASVGANVAGFLTALSTASYAKVIDGATFAAIGSDIFNPVTIGIEGNSYGAGTSVGDSRAWAHNFIGRTSGGRRVRLMVFGATTLGADYRFVSGEAALVTAARNYLASAGPGFVAIDGLNPVWATYVNALASVHWQKALRP